MDFSLHFAGVAGLLVTVVLALRVYFDRYLTPRERLGWTAAVVLLPVAGYLIFLIVRAYRLPGRARAASGIKHG